MNDHTQKYNINFTFIWIICDICPSWLLSRRKWLYLQPKSVCLIRLKRLLEILVQKMPSYKKWTKSLRKENNKKSEKMGKDLEKQKCTLENTRQRLDQTKSKLSKLYKTFNKSGKPKYVVQTMKRRNVQLNFWKQKSKQLVLQEQLRRNSQAMRRGPKGCEEKTKNVKVLRD